MYNNLHTSHQKGGQVPFTNTLYVDMKSKNAFDLKIMFNFGEKSTFQNVLLFIKTKVPDMFVLGTWWLVDQSYTLCTTKKTPNFVDLTVSQSDKIAML